jgi:type IV secretion system protein VirD4
MQLPPDDELVLVSGCAPIRAKKARYYEDPELKARILQPPTLSNPRPTRRDETPSLPPDGDWAGAVVAAPAAAASEDPANASIRREPELPEHEEIVPEPKKPVQEFEPMDEEPDDEVQRQRIMRRTFGAVARQVSLDPGDDMQM